MNPALIDTDILSEILKGVDRRVAQRAADYRAEAGRYTISAVTVMEVVKGLHRVGAERRLRQFLDGLRHVEVVAFDGATAELAGRMYGDLERTGQPIGRADPQIAASAVQRGLTLVTGNIDHYERIVKLGYALGLENWRLG